MKKFLLILSLSLSMMACGWHLRGSQNNSAAIKQINLDATDIYSPLYRTFKQEFERRNIELVNNNAAPRLKLLSEIQSSRIVSFNTELNPAEDELTLSIHYLINDQLFEAQEKRAYQLNKNRAAARENERQLLIEQMRRQIFEKVLHHAGLIHNASTSSITPRENISR